VILISVIEGKVSSLKALHRDKLIHVLDSYQNKEFELLYHGIDVSIVLIGALRGPKRRILLRQLRSASIRPVHHGKNGVV
jgi:hypothetical protein